MIKIKKIIFFSFKILIFVITSIVLSLLGLYLYAYLSPKIPIKTNGKFFIYDNYDELVYQGSSSSEWINIEDINDNMKKAIVSVEDKNFYSHNGFDYLRILHAIIQNIKSGYLAEGASTISQQYVKNMYLSFDKTWSRKIEEAMLTLELEVHYDKNEILEGYLNTINFGQGNYGVEDAAKYYFNKSAKNLSLEEACILAGIPKSPENYNPVANYDVSINRGKVVAWSMYNNGYISKEEYNGLFKSEIPIYGHRDKKSLQTLMYYQNAVLEELSTIDNIPKSLINSGGLKIYTAFDFNIQSNLEEAIKSNMKDDNTEVAAIYVNPNDGGVSALVGGRNYSKTQFNRATQAKRQVGSTIKPFLYYAALANGLTMASTFTSESTVFNLSNNVTYAPANYGNIYANKQISMAAALAYSDNVYAVKTHMFLGENTLVDTLKIFGIKDNVLAVPSLALGTMETSMINYANAYIKLASGGYDRNIHLIKKVEDVNGNLLYEYKNKNTMILNSNYTFIINEMLTNSYNQDFLDYNSPTALSIKGLLTKKYAIKTGTTDNDHWVVGFNPDALLMVWTGMDDNSDEASGYSKITKLIWADTMESSLKDKDKNWYEMPQNVIGIPLNPVTGDFVTTGKSTMYYFVKGSEPEYYIYVSK